MLAQADPFEPKYFGGKVPDSSTLPSIALPVTYTFEMSTAATSQPNFIHGWAFQPAVYDAVYRATSGASTLNWTFNAAQFSDAPNATSFGTNFEAFRPVAHGIRLSCPLAPTSTTGFVHIAVATETAFTGTGSASSGTIAQLAPTIQEMSGYAFYRRVTLASLTQSPITLVNKWTDETAFRYTSPFARPGRSAATDLTFNIPFQYGILLVVVEGASSSTTAGSITPLQAEIALHTECIPSRSSGLIGSTAAAYSPPILTAVSSAVAQTDFSHTEDQQESFVTRFVSEVTNAMPEGTADTMYSVASNLGRFALRSAMNYGMSAMGRRGIGGVNNDANRLMITN